MGGMAGKGTPFAGTLLVYSVWLLAWFFAGSLFEVYFFGMGMPLQDIFLADSCWFMAALITIPFIRGFRARDSMLAGIAVSFAAVMLLLIVHETWAAFVFRFLVGFTHVFFWAPINTLFYENRKGNNATLGALYYAISPVLSLFAPAFAGLIATVSGFDSLFALAASLFALLAAMALALVDNRRQEFGFMRAMGSLSGLKTLIFLEGFSAALAVGVTLPLMLLTFVSSPMEFGGITSLVTVFSVLASFFTAGISDRMGSRGRFLVASAALFSLSAMGASFAPDLTLFFAAFGLVTFFSRVFFPMPLALAVDNSKSLPDTMLAREFLLNAGRLGGSMLGYAVLLNWGLEAVLLMQGALILLFLPAYWGKRAKLASR